MSNTTLIILGVAGFFLAGFIIVGTSEKSDEEKKKESFVRNYSVMTQMATQMCSKAVKKHTNVQVYGATSTQGDKETYQILTWADQKEGFKNAKCTFTRANGGITDLVIDGKTLISRKAK